jgi:hypothetical protein
VRLFVYFYEFGRAQPVVPALHVRAGEYELKQRFSDIQVHRRLLGSGV